MYGPYRSYGYGYGRPGPVGLPELMAYGPPGPHGYGPHGYAPHGYHNGPHNDIICCKIY